jgi:hypothetical protein
LREPLLVTPILETIRDGKAQFAVAAIAFVKEIRMATDAMIVHREAHTKIRTRIVAALKKEFGLEQAPGLQIDFGNHVDTWLSLPADFSKGELSNERIVAALQKEFSLWFERASFVRFDGAKQGADVWLPIPPDFLKGDLSDDESHAVAGRSIMVRWDIFPGKFLQEVEPGELLLIGLGIFQQGFFEQEVGRGQTSSRGDACGGVWSP